MSTLETLATTAFGANYVYLQILQRYKFNSNELHYIFEGDEDQSFYGNYLQEIDMPYRTYVSHGKKHSIELYNAIDWEKYDKMRIILFIDRDYSRILGETVPTDENIYETTYYSIENYVSNSQNLRRLINEVLHFNNGEIIDSIISIYNEQVVRFSELIKPLISWILIIRSNNLKANLNMIDMDKLFKIDPNLSIRKVKIDRIKYLQKVTGVTTPTSFGPAFKHWYGAISNLESYKLYLRGKYEMWFLISFFNAVQTYLETEQGHKSKRKTFITLSNCIEIIGPRSQQPERLHDFIENISNN